MLSSRADLLIPYFWKKLYRPRADEPERMLYLSRYKKYIYDRRHQTWKHYMEILYVTFCINKWLIYWSHSLRFLVKTFPIVTLHFNERMIRKLLNIRRKSGISTNLFALSSPINKRFRLEIILFFHLMRLV